MSQAKEKILKKIMTVVATSVLMIGALCYSKVHSLYSIPDLRPKRLRKSHDGFSNYNNLDSQNKYNCHDKIFALGKAGNGSVLPGDFLDAPWEVIAHPWLYRHIVSKELI